MHKLFEFFRLVSAKLFNSSFFFFLFYICIFFSLWSSWKTLPRKWASKEVKNDMPNSFKIISSRLFITKMCINTSISGSTCKIFSISERNMFPIRTFVAFSKTKINNVNSIFSLVISSNQKVIRLDVSMNNSFFMHNFDSLDHLNSDMEYCL